MPVFFFVRHVIRLDHISLFLKKVLQKSMFVIRNFPTIVEITRRKTIIVIWKRLADLTLVKIICFFYYFETRTDTNNLMITFYCVVQNVCKKCENIDFKKGSNEVECCECCFDTIFIFKYILEKKKIFPESIMCGNKVMMLFIPDENIYFFDSYSFLHMMLSAIPKAMDISNLCKGFHPFFFFFTI